MKQIIHIFGLTDTGKTTIGQILKNKLNNCQFIDADCYRGNLNKDLSFTKEDRLENIRRLQAVADNLDCDYVIVSAITPYEESRREDDFKIYLQCPLEVLKQRDTKGLYSNGKLNDIYFEEPTNPNLTLNTSRLSIDECVDLILKKL